MDLTTVGDDIQLDLYRRVIPIDVHNMGFVGFTGSVSFWLMGEVISH